MSTNHAATADEKPYKPSVGAIVTLAVVGILAIAVYILDTRESDANAGLHPELQSVLDRNAEYIEYPRQYPR